MFGEKVPHGTIFRRTIEEGLNDLTRMYQIGLRGTGYRCRLIWVSTLTGSTRQWRPVRVRRRSAGSRPRRDWK
jgi:hypothetical protein